MNLTREELAEQAASLAVQGVYIGTSSWKYEGWCGMLYDRARYEYRGKFAETRFKRDCLAEYAEVFKTICVNAAYYTFPSQQYLEDVANKTLGDSVREAAVSPKSEMTGPRPGTSLRSTRRSTFPGTPG